MKTDNYFPVQFDLHLNIKAVYDLAVKNIFHSEHVSFNTFMKHVREMKKEALHFYGTDFIEMRFMESRSSSGETYEGFLVFVVDPPKNLYKRQKYGKIMQMPFAKNAWKVGWIDVAKGYVQR